MSPHLVSSNAQLQWPIQVFQMSARAPLAAFLLLLACLAGVAAEFTDDFHRFLDTNYGRMEGARLEREDMGRFLWGSFGGKLESDQPINNEVSGGEWTAALGL